MQRNHQPPPLPNEQTTTTATASSMSYAHHATITYRDVRSAGLPVRPLDFPPPKVRAGVRVNALVVHPQTGSRQVCSGVIHREDLSSLHKNYHRHRNAALLASSQQSSSKSSSSALAAATATTTPSHNSNRNKSTHPSSPQQDSTEHKIGAPVTVSPSSPQQQQQSSSSTANTGSTEQTPSSSSTAAQHQPSTDNSSDEADDEVLAYWPQRRLQDAIYGSVWACLVLRRHYGVAADDAARAAHVEPGSPEAPIVWEITGQHVAIKMVEWSRVHHMRGRLLEDPVKEVAALQMLDIHPNVLHSTEVLQDADFLYSVMPYCRDGDLFGIVVKYAEDSGGEVGMPEPVARYWFRQILNVRAFAWHFSLIVLTAFISY
jgi:Protein kinase domain